MDDSTQKTFPQSSDPKAVLKVLIDEIEKPINAIQAITELSALEAFESISEVKEYFQRIQTMSLYIRSLLDDGHAYLEEQSDTEL